MNQAKRRLSHFHPGRVILSAISIAIGAGTFLLALPIARTTSVPLIDLVFTSTSALCVTGLFTVPLSSFSSFGHTVLLLLIQIGGLGIITLTLFVVSLFVNLGFTAQVMAGQLLDLDSWKNIKRILISIMFLTLSVEFIGACAVFPFIRHTYPFKKALFLSVFHSVSSFCNAGVSLFEGYSFSQFEYNYPMLFVTSLLMLAGSLGFIVWIDIFRYLKSRKQKKRYTFSLLTKIVVSGTLILIVGGALVLWILERSTTFSAMPFPQAVLHALFQSIALRSTGFLAVPLNIITYASLFFMMFLAFIGAAPGSTGSGVKITTFSIYLSTIASAITGRTAVDIKGRQIPKDQVFKSTAIVSLSMVWILVTILFLLITEHYGSPFDVIFETVSAFTNIGITTGFARVLSLSGKLFIMLSMIIGRIGSLTLLSALKKPSVQEEALKPFISYPEERVMLS